MFGSWVNNILALIALVGSFLFINWVKKNTLGQNLADSLTNDEKVWSWVLSLCNPIIFAVIGYFGLKNKFPTKAKNVAQIAAWVFLIYIVIAFVLVFAGVVKIPV